MGRYGIGKAWYLTVEAVVDDKGNAWIAFDGGAWSRTTAHGKSVHWAIYYGFIEYYAAWSSIELPEEEIQVATKPWAGVWSVAGTDKTGGHVEVKADSPEAVFAAIDRLPVYVANFGSVRPDLRETNNQNHAAYRLGGQEWRAI